MLEIPLINVMKALTDIKLEAIRAAALKMHQTVTRNSVYQF